MWRRIVIWIIGLAVLAAMVLGDMMPMFAMANEAVAIPALTIAPPAIERIHVAQQQPRKKRRTLLDMLFGNDEE